MQQPSSTDQTKEAARHTAAAAQLTKDSADRRTELAAERTYAAWMRTGLVALASGVGSRKLLEGVVPGWMIVGFGTVLILFSAFCFVAGVWRQLLVGAPPAAGRAAAATRDPRGRERLPRSRRAGGAAGRLVWAGARCLSAGRKAGASRRLEGVETLLLSHGHG